MNRRRVLALGGAALASPMIARKTAWAQGKQLYMTCYLGAMANFLNEKVIPEFQKEHGCQVFNRPNNSLQTISILRSERGNPMTSVVMMDDLAVPIAKQEKLIQKMPLDRIPNSANLHEGYSIEDAHAFAILISSIAPWYNTAALNPAPTSWADLWDERLRGRFLMVTAKYTQSVPLLVMTAALQTGKPIIEAQYEMLNAGEKLRELKPNVQAIQDNVSAAILSVSQGQADISGPDYSKNIYPSVVNGAPIALMDPKEGKFAGVNTICLANNAPEPELAAAFINYMLSPEIQKALAETTFAAPSVKGITLKNEISEKVPQGQEELAKLIKLDWNWINPRRNQIIDLFNQTIG